MIDNDDDFHIAAAMIGGVFILVLTLLALAVWAAPHLGY